MEASASSSGAETTKQAPLEIKEYVACIIDVLGQTTHLRGWNELPPGDILPPEILASLRATVGTVLKLQRMFEDFFKSSERSLTDAVTEDLTTEQQQMLRRMQSSRLSMRQFGDTFLFYSPLTNHHGDVTAIPLYRMLIACGMIMHLSLVYGISLRGAISIGPGVEMDGGLFYGPVLADVHGHESRIAGYPRIVVSERAVEFAKADLRFTVGSAPAPISLIEQCQRSVAESCREFMCRDGDGCIIVDFMGEAVLTQVHDAGLTFPVEKAYQFVKGEQERFNAAGDDKLAERYRQLRDYMQQRLSLWLPTS